MDGEGESLEHLDYDTLSNLLDRAYYSEFPAIPLSGDENHDENLSGADKNEWSRLPSPWTDDETRNAATLYSEAHGWTLCEGVSSYQLRHVVSDLRDKLPVDERDVYLENGEIVIEAGREVFRIRPRAGQRYEMFKGNKRISGASSYAETLNKLFDLLDVDEDDLEESAGRKPLVETVSKSAQPVKTPTTIGVTLKERFLMSRECSGRKNRV